MPLSMYQASIPVFLHTLTNLCAILDKASSYAAEKKIDETVLVNSRLAPDMFPLSRQIQIATDGAKGCAARLCGGEVPSYPDTEATLPELKARLEKTISYLKTIKPSQIDGTEDKDITLKVGKQEMSFKGQAYLLYFVLPNLYFHATTCYAILRHNGVSVGKMDYLGAVPSETKQSAAA